MNRIPTILRQRVSGDVLWSDQGLFKMHVGVRLRPAYNPIYFRGRVFQTAFWSVHRELWYSGHCGNVFPDCQHRVHSEHGHELLSLYAQRHGQALEKYVSDDPLLHRRSYALGLPAFPSGLWPEWNLDCQWPPGPAKIILNIHCYWHTVVMFIVL